MNTLQQPSFAVQEPAAPHQPNNGHGERLLLTASTLKGDPVVNLKDETLGHLEEIMLDVKSGRIAYAVMASGGFLGLGERLFAIPWSAMVADTERQCLVMDASKERFEKAPGFDKQHWPLTNEHGWQVEVHDYYGARPYWD